MSLSKPVMSFLSFYFGNLYNNPIRTKAISCCVVASTGNLVSQYISGNNLIDHQSLFAYAVFGLLFGGTIPHYFYSFLEQAIPRKAAFGVSKRLLIERLIFSPFFQAFNLYVLGRLENKSHKAVLKELQILYPTILIDSWKYLTVLQLINLMYVPPMLRVLFQNLVGFFWMIYLTNKRMDQKRKSKGSQ